MADATEVLTIKQVASLGGFATARKLTAEQRRESAKRAARARWAKKHGAPTPPTHPDPKGPQWVEGDLGGDDIAGILLSPPKRKPARQSGAANDRAA